MIKYYCDVCDVEVKNHRIYFGSCYCESCSDVVDTISGIMDERCTQYNIEMVSLREQYINEYKQSLKNEKKR